MSKKTAGVVDVHGGLVRRTNRFFVTLRAYGHCDENGRTVLGIGCSAKKIPAPPDRPLALVAAIIEELLPAMQYSSVEAMKKDVESFKAFIDMIEVTQ